MERLASKSKERSPSPQSKLMDRLSSLSKSNKSDKPAQLSNEGKGMFGQLETIIKKRIFEVEVGRTAKGFVRIHSFSTTMSVTVINFGLKLYNLQNLREITDLIGEKPPKLNFQAGLDPIDYMPVVSQKTTVWDPMNEINTAVAARKEAITRNFDHTEFELMRLLYGDTEGWYLMFKVIKEEKVNQRYDELKSKNMDLNVKYARKQQQESD